MYKSRLKYQFLIIFILLFSQCSNNKTGNHLVVAQVGDNKLYLDELSKIVPTSINKDDSTIIADDYIKKWIKQELLIQKANENLTPAQKDVSKELKEYRNSLIIYKYKNELMKQRMDTTVTKNQIEQYYNEHPDNFNLNTDIVKAIFVKIPNEVANPDQLKLLIENTSEEGLEELREYCLQYAKGFDLFMDRWVDFEMIRKNLPPVLSNNQRLLTGKKQIEAKDSNYYYLVSIQDYRLRNQIAPLEYVEDNIKSLILNQRKITFLKEVEKNIYKEGVRQNKFTIYNVDKQETEKLDKKQ